MELINLENVLMALLVADALTLGGLVLIQQGRGADAGASFGSGSANTMFGSGGAASFLTRMTAWLAIGFFLISFGLAYTAKERATSVDTLGIPIVGAPLSQSEENLQADLADQVDKLTPEPESVNSDIPDL
ncbi:MAG: preprotein translocase subunit SecG [Proteobacteria bacterium]|nr:preprotein translocase subunit SecG [Pseudomonadota bacterium]